MKRSPIYAHFSETISGVSTIRAYNRVEAFVEKSDVLIDGNNMAYYPSVVSNRFDGQLNILYLIHCRSSEVSVTRMKVCLSEQNLL